MLMNIGVPWKRYTYVSHLVERCTTLRLPVGFSVKLHPIHARSELLLGDQVVYLTSHIHFPVREGKSLKMIMTLTGKRNQEDVPKMKRCRIENNAFTL